MEGQTLYLDVGGLKRLLLQDGRLSEVDINLVNPGDRVRILNLMDVVQPRCKIGDGCSDFPGFISPLRTAGSGRTRALRGICVLVSNPHTRRKYSAFLDMSGIAAELSRYARQLAVSLSVHPAPGVDERDFENAAKEAGLRAAAYLASEVGERPAEMTEVFDLDLPFSRGDGLPRIGYYFQLYSPQHDHLGLSDPVFYGSAVRGMRPTIVHPNEIIDGAVVGAHTIRSLDTYSVQNHALIGELYARHQRDLNFVGVVCGVAVLEPDDRDLNAQMAATLAKHVLGAEGMILSKVHGGLPHVDLARVAEECEKQGVRTALFNQPLISKGYLPETIPFTSDKLNLIIGVGATLERIRVPLSADTFVGGEETTKIYSPDPVIQRAGDSVIEVEQFLIAGVHDLLGGASIIVKQY